jgi:VanZ family protein
METCQLFIPGRGGNIPNWFWSSAGAVCGMLAARAFADRLLPER